jgi:hypothetical protein
MSELKNFNGFNANGVSGRDTRLSNKIPTDLFQRHRDTENWTWKTHGDTR